ELMIERAREALSRVDLSDGAVMLDQNYGLQTTCNWVKHKFDIDVQPDEIRDLELEQLKELVCRRAGECYDLKESEYPIMAGLLRYSTGKGPQSRIDREGIIHWARERFEADLNIEDFRNKQREEIRTVLLKCSTAHQSLATVAMQEAKKKVENIFGPAGEQPSADEEQTAVMAPGGKGAIQSLSHWLKDNVHCELSEEDIRRLNREELDRKVVAAVEDRYHPELRRMERSLLLQIVDAAWKDHLLSMDHLRSSIGLAGYAQMDPKVEYKREGMRLFDTMWTSMGERVTDLIFRMEQLDEEFIGSTWVETSARHEDAQTAAEVANEHEAAIRANQGEAKIETIRNRGQRVGRNDPCPCGSGKKYKQCCMRKATIA
ncbi:MAG: SEC-C metal-binding domain-containing protein, partial [Pirellulaceae bacterium]